MATPVKYWVTLSGRGSAQLIEIYESPNSPKAGFAGLSWSVHGPYTTLKAAAKYAKSLGGETTPVMNAQGQQIGVVNDSNPAGVTGSHNTKTSQDNSSSAAAKRVQAAGGTVGDLPNPLSGIAAIGDFFNKLTETSTWIRVGKVVIGGTLLIIGIAHMTGASGAVADVARKAPLPI